MRLGSRIAWRRALAVALTIGGCLAGLPSGGGRASPASAAAAFDPRTALQSLSARRVVYVRHLAASSVAAGGLGTASGGGGGSWLPASPRRLLAGSGRQRQLPEQEPPGSVQLLSMLFSDASLSDPEEYWQLPPPPPPGTDRAPAAGFDPAQQGDTAAQVVNQITDHLADMVPAAGSVRPPAFQHMDTLLRVAENRMAKPTCVYPGAVITAILSPIYGQTTYWAGCNSTQSYMIVAAACLGERQCAVLASNDVFGDPCPGATKSLTFTYRCEVQGGAGPVTVPSSPEPQSPPPPSPPPPSPRPPAASPPPQLPSPPPPSPPPPSPIQPSPSPQSNGPTVDFGPLTPVPPRTTTPVSPYPPADLAFPPMATPWAPNTLRMITGGGCFFSGNTKMKGAKGDGLTDDSVALQAAASASSAPMLYLPLGTYRLSSAITIDKTLVAGAFTRILLDRGVTLTLTKQPKRAPSRTDPFFIGEGKVVFRGEGIEIYPDWWKKESVSDTWAMQAAINSCSQQTCTLLQSRTLYSTEGGVYLHNRVRFFSTAKANFHSLGGNGEGVTLQPGSYSEPLSFSGLYGFNQWGLRLLPGVQDVNIQAGFVSRNRQGILLTARSGAKTKLSNVTFSHVSVTQDNINSVVFNSADASGSLFEDVTVRVNFEVMGGTHEPKTPSAGVIFRGGVPTLQNTKFILQANDPAQFNGKTSYVGIATDTLGPVSNFVYRSECWNGGFEPPGQYLTGVWSGSFFFIGLSAGGWRADLFTFGPGSSNNVLNAGAVASAAANWAMTTKSGNLARFKDGRPFGEQGFYVNIRVNSDWRPGERRTYYLFSPFAQGVNSGAQMHCIPFRAWNPGLVCESLAKAPAAPSGYASYQIAVNLVNYSQKTIPAGFTHISAVQLTP
ncbi:hypothetical protein ABPG75_001926 [Micractinium tetrahymenae]